MDLHQPSKYGQLDVWRVLQALIESEYLGPYGVQGGQR